MSDRGPDAGPRARPDWDAFLEELTRRVDEQRSAVAEERYADVRPLRTPEALGPVPARLAARALAVLAEMTAIEAAVGERLDRLGRQATAARHAARRLDRHGAMFFDRSG